MTDYASQTCYASERWMAGEGYPAPPGPPPGREQGTFAPPSGPPPGREQRAFAPPSGPPPGNVQVTAFAPPSGPPPQIGVPSQLTGKRKALLIGINYIGSQNALRGCANDVANVENFITHRFGYNVDDIVILIEQNNSPRGQPTRQNIISAMHWLVAGAARNDSLFFHYSGHGTQVQAQNSADGDGMAEAICPLDFSSAGVITDLEIFDILVRPLPEGCRLTAIFDSCHSGTVMNLPYMLVLHKGHSQGGEQLLHRGWKPFAQSATEYARGDSIGAATSIFSAAQGIFNKYTAAETLKKTNTSPADVILWSGCKDAQTSADTQEAGQATGAMSYAFVAALNKYPRVSYKDLLVAIREEMKRGGYSQKPQMSASHPIDTNREFMA